MSVVDADAICVENIPQALKDQRSWVTWRLEREGERSVKPPYNPRTSQKAKSNDSSTWGSFGEALGALAEGYDGIGFELAPPIVGIDLDGCREPETGFIDDGARAIIDELDSYTEVSPSGRGIHILAKGQLPPWGRRTKSVEIYDRDRYFTVTGQHVAGTPLAVEARSAELAALHLQLFGTQRSSVSSPTVESVGSTEPHASASLSDDELVAKMKAAGNGDRFERLWQGERQDDEHRSPSEADFDLCRTFLAFWTGKDPERMDRLFRQSGLYRPKWDERHSTRTYGEITIANAIKMQQFTCPPSALAGGDA